MMKYVVCGTSVEDVEAGVKAMKMAIASGATCGVGGSTMAEVEKSLDAMKQMMGGATAPTPKVCSCSCPRSVSGREALKAIENAKSCKATAGSNVTIHDLILGNGNVFICEDEDEDEEDIGFCDGYMGFSVDGEELSDLCDTPEEAMAETIGGAIDRGYSLGDIGIYAVRVYDNGTVETVATIHRPIN